MKVFVCDDHFGHWPVPTASVVVAKNKNAARMMLIDELNKRGIDDDRFTLKEIDTRKPQTIVLSDGDY